MWLYKDMSGTFIQNSEKFISTPSAEHGECFHPPSLPLLSKDSCCDPCLHYFFPEISVCCPAHVSNPAKCNHFAAQRKSILKLACDLQASTSVSSTSGASSVTVSGPRYFSRGNLMSSRFLYPRNQYPFCPEGLPVHKKFLIPRMDATGNLQIRKGFVVSVASLLFDPPPEGYQCRNCKAFSFCKTADLGDNDCEEVVFIGPHLPMLVKVELFRCSQCGCEVPFDPVAHLNCIQMPPSFSAMPLLFHLSILDLVVKLYNSGNGMTDGQFVQSLNTTYNAVSDGLYQLSVETFRLWLPFALSRSTFQLQSRRINLFFLFLSLILVVSTLWRPMSKRPQEWHHMGRLQPRQFPRFGSTRTKTMAWSSFLCPCPFPNLNVRISKHCHSDSKCSREHLYVGYKSIPQCPWGRMRSKACLYLRSPFCKTQFQCLSGRGSSRYRFSD